MRKSKEQEAPLQHRQTRDVRHVGADGHGLGPDLRPIRTAVALVVLKQWQGGRVVRRVRGELSHGQRNRQWQC